MPLFSRKSTKNSSPPRRTRIVSDSQKHDEGRESRSSLYRRGRTMAGSTGHTLRAAQPHAINNATPREKVRHLTNLRRKLSFVFSALLGTIVLLAIFLQQFTAGVKVEFGDAAHASNDALYERTIQDYLAQNPLERLRFNVDEHKLNTFVISHRPEVEKVTQLGYAAPVTSSFEITLRKPVVSWQVQDKQYFVDAHGVSFTDNVYTAPPVKIVDNSGVEHTSGTAIASARFLTFVGKAVALAQQDSMKVTQVAIPTGTSRQVEISLEGHPYPVIMSIDRPAGEQVEDMQRTVQFFDKQGRVPRYIDIRVKGKAFFRE